MSDLYDGLPIAGIDVAGHATDYATVVTSPLRECRNIHIACGDNGARVSLDGETSVAFYVPANCERAFTGLRIPPGTAIKAKRYDDSASAYTLLAISVW